MKRELFAADGSSRGFYSELNRVNDLTGKEWLYWTRSVISRPYPPDLQHKLRREHGGQKPPRLCSDLIKVFTKAGQRVLDPFMGVGGVLLGAELAGRTAVGMELNPRWVEIYREVCLLEGLRGCRALVGDSTQLLTQLDQEPFDLVLTDVPYWQMDTARRSSGTFKRTGEDARPRRVSRLGAFNDQVAGTKVEWVATTAAILHRAADRLREGAYLVTFVGDMYCGGEYHCLSAELGAAVASAGLVWKANLVWYDVSKSLHIYGYQYAYIPSIIHQNVLVFRKGSPGSIQEQSAEGFSGGVDETTGKGGTDTGAGSRRGVGDHAGDGRERRRKT